MRSSEVAGIPCLAYPNLSHDTQSTKSKDGNYQNKHESNNNHKNLKIYLFGSIFWSCNFLFTRHNIRTLEGHLPIGGIIINHHRPSLGCVQANILQSSWHKAILMKNFRGWNDGLPPGLSRLSLKQNLTNLSLLINWFIGIHKIY